MRKEKQKDRAKENIAVRKRETKRQGEREHCIEKNINKKTGIKNQMKKVQGSLWKRQREKNKDERDREKDKRRKRQSEGDKAERDMTKETRIKK